MSALPDTLNLAAAGGLDLARAADIASNVMSGFNLMGGDVAAEMSRVSDVLAAAASSSNTDINQLGDAMSYAAPVASAYGISLEESAGAIAIFSNAGIQGSRAGMTLKNSISQLANPVGATAKKLKELGLSAADVNPEVNSMADIIEKLEGAGAKATDAISLVGAEAGPGFAAMLAVGSKGLRKYTEEFENAEGTASRMAADLTDNLGGDFKALGSMWEALKLQLFFSQEGFLRWAVQGVTKLVAVVVDFLPAIGNFAKTFKAAFIGIGVAIGALGAAIAVVVALKFAMMGIALVASPIGLLVAGLAALGATAGIILNKFLPLKEIFGNLMADVQMFFGILTGNANLPAPGTQGYDEIMEIFWRVNPVAEKFAGVMLRAKESVKPLGDAIKNLFNAMKPATKSAETLGEAFANFGKKAEPSISLFDKVIAVLDEVFNAVSTFGYAIGDMVDFIKSPMQTLFKYMKEAPEKAAKLAMFGAAFKGLKDAIDSAVSSIGEKWKSFTSMFGESSFTLGDVWSITVGLFTAGFNAMADIINIVTPIISGALDFIIELVSGLMGLFSSVGDTMTNAFSRVGEAWDLVVGVISRGAEFIGEVLTTLSAFISPIMEIIGLAFDIVAYAAQWLFFNVIAPGAELAMTVIEVAWSLIGPILEFFAQNLGIVADAAIWLWENALVPLADYVGGQMKGTLETATSIVDSLGGAFEWVGAKVSGATDKIKTFVDWVKNIEMPSFDFSLPSFGGKGKGHYHGIDSVPYDGYQATLHRGERVQTAQEVRAEKNGKAGGGGVVIQNINLNSSATNARQLYNEFVDILSKELATEVEFA